MWGNIAIAFVLSFITAFMATPYTIKLANKIGAVDVPKDARRMRKKAMPKFGGPAVILGFLIATIYLLITMSIEGSINLFNADNYGVKLIGMLLGIIVLEAVCIRDDIKPIKPITKLIGQLAAAIIVVSFGIKIEHIEIPFLYNVGLNNVFSVILTIGWIVGVTNAINLIDGLDGLSSGIAMISSISLLVIFALNGSPLIAIILAATLAGSLIGFLPFNFSPAKTFIGDTGANFLGFSLSVISILGMAKTYTAAIIVLPVIILGLPIFDTVSAIIRRLIKGKSLKAIFEADKGHLHHRIVAKGFTQKKAVLILYGITAVCGICAIVLFESGVWKAISFALIVTAVVMAGYKNFINNETDVKAKYECSVCKYIYNPKYGNERNGISPNTAFENLPENWTCPVCGEGKDVFELHE